MQSALLLIMVLLILLVVLPIIDKYIPFGKKVVMFSKFKGKLVINGDTPVPEATLVQRWEKAWDGAKGEQTVVTDKNGNFEFPRAIERSIAATYVPLTPAIKQTICVQENGTEKEVWYAQKPGFEDLAEIKALEDYHDGMELDVVCHLDKEWTDGEEFLYASTCKLRQ